MKILITGANGMVARAAIGHCIEIGDDVKALTRSQFDILDRDAVFATIDEFRPDAVLNCAAFTDVDGAETYREACYAANAVGPENLALGCREYDAVLVTISTDYVFDGRKSGFYTQRDTPNPEGVYALSKLEGEMRVRDANARSIIVRSGWIYGPGGTNFLSVMHRLLGEGKRIKAIGDSYGTPTYAVDLARRLREFAELDLPCTYHVVNAGEGTSYHGFAREVCRLGSFDPDLIDEVSKADLSRPAPRPDSSKMSCLFSSRFGLEPMPEWREALASFLSSEI